MDYELVSDVTGTVLMRMIDGQEALANWFNDEVKGQLALLDDVEAAIRQIAGTERLWRRVGKEYTLEIQGDAVNIFQNLLTQEATLPEDLQWYAAESEAEIGIEDFLQVVASYRRFVLTGR